MEMLPYPQNIVFDILGSLENVNFEEFEESFSYVISNEKFSQREIDVLKLRYIEKKTLKFIGTKYGVTRERIRTIQNSCLKKLAKPENARFIKYGLTGIKNVEKDNSQAIAGYSDTIDILKLSVRSYHYLKAEGITNISQLVKMTDDEIMSVKKLGRKSAKEIIDKLSLCGYKRFSRTVDQDIFEILHRYDMTKEELIDKVRSI